MALRHDSQVCLISHLSIVQIVIFDEKQSILSKIQVNPDVVQVHAVRDVYPEGMTEMRSTIK